AGGGAVFCARPRAAAKVSVYLTGNNENMRTHRALLLFVAATSAPAALLAQQAPQPDSTFGLGTVEVIGHREAVATSQTTDVVDAEKLAAQHRDDLSEALDLIPGVSVQNLGQRRERLISVRGFSSRQVPLFIDGI